MSRDVGVASRRSAACVRRVELYTIESRFPPRSGCRIQGYTTFYGKTLVKFGAKGGWHKHTADLSIFFMVHVFMAVGQIATCAGRHLSVLSAPG